MARADRAFVLSVLLVPLVLVALVLAMKKPRHEVAKAIERVTRRYVGTGGHTGAQQSDGREGRARGGARPMPRGEGGGRRLPPAPPFDRSVLERCSEKGGLVLGRDAYLVDALLNDDTVSRRHARLTRYQGLPLHRRSELFERHEGQRAPARTVRPHGSRARRCREARQAAGRAVGALVTSGAFLSALRAWSSRSMP